MAGTTSTIIDPIVSTIAAAVFRPRNTDRSFSLIGNSIRASSPAHRIGPTNGRMIRSTAPPSTSAVTSPNTRG